MHEVDRQMTLRGAEPQRPPAAVPEERRAAAHAFSEIAFHRPDRGAQGFERAALGGGQRREVVVRRHGSCPVRDELSRLKAQAGSADQTQGDVERHPDVSLLAG
jgi:hypothetical protein